MTTPVTPETLITKLKTDYTWLTHHLIMLGVVGALVIGSVYGVENLIAKHDMAAEQRADAKLAVFVATTQAHEAVLEQTQTQLITMVSQLQAQNSQLAQTISVRNTQTQRQVQKDATLSAQEAAQRLTQQTKASPGEIVANGDLVTISLPITRNIVASLDLFSATQANLVDTQKQLANETVLFNKSQEVNGQQATVISDLKVQNAEQLKACAAEVKTVKSQARKSKIKWFFIGLITGFVGAHAAGI
jgi:uncharacterized Zn ribbon protein